MFRQLLTPVEESLPLSLIVAALPVLAVLVLLGVVRRPAWEASLAGLVVGLLIAIGVWGLPIYRPIVRRREWGHDKIGATAYANLDRRGT